jgi:hypothetical protein
MRLVTYEQAERVARSLHRDFGREPWCNGIGVEREGSAFVVSVRVSTGEALARNRVPRSLDGVRINIVARDIPRAL